MQKCWVEFFRKAMKSNFRPISSSPSSTFSFIGSTQTTACDAAASIVCFACDAAAASSISSQIVAEMGHTWSNEHLKCLLQTCIDEVNSVGRKRLSLHKESWKKLGTVIKKKHGVDLNQRQLKNAYDNLKQKYAGWLYLKNKTDNLYNPQTNSFNLTNEEWEDFKKGHPKAASLKTIPLPFPDLCAELFDGNSATGNLVCTTSQTTSGHGSSSGHVQQLQLMDTLLLT